ncbi:MAG: hypothetical protein CSA55_05515 [Ilumatobacter coccineus]|uniref:Probable membrane transporter protein n=1 Tax=Ilumatobacter coccineus TaxID=467094 RepID=A0A2G6K982_9ACTN|nr:MAG: hypothetical protein CSA55_05515 [Ilumatobacter coccineus]
MMVALTVLDIDVAWLVVCIAMMAVGATLQTTIGIGLGLVTAPLLSLVDPSFVPGALVLSTIPLTLGMAIRERHAIHMRQIWWAIAGRVPGVILGSWVALIGGRSAVAIVVGVSVLIAVGASLTKIRFHPSPHNLLAAGTVSGFSGTVSGIGGPPMALTYQHADPATMRANLAVFFVFGSTLSVISLTVSGVMGTREWILGATLMPGVVAGLVIGKTVTARLPASVIRPLVLAVCSISAIVLILNTLV